EFVHRHRQRQHRTRPQHEIFAAENDSSGTGITRRSASADSETPDPATKLRREIAIVSEALANHRQCVRCNNSHWAITCFTPPSGQFSLFLEPAHHYPVEGIGLVDVAEVVGVWDLLVAGTRYQFGELAHRWFRAVWILGTAERQCRDPNRREL